MDEHCTKDIIKRIKERRMKLGLSYQDLAEKTGISKSTLQRYETGFIKNLPIDKLEILAKSLNTTPGYLMGWDKNEDYIPLEGKIDNPEDAIKLILKQPSIMNYGGYNIQMLSDNELVEFANELLRQLQFLSYKYKK